MSYIKSDNEKSHRIRGGLFLKEGDPIKSVYEKEKLKNSLSFTSIEKKYGQFLIKKLTNRERFENFLRIPARIAAECGFFFSAGRGRFQRVRQI